MSDCSVHSSQSRLCQDTDTLTCHATEEDWNKANLHTFDGIVVAVNQEGLGLSASLIVCKESECKTYLAVGAEVSVATYLFTLC